MHNRMSSPCKLLGLSNGLAEASAFARLESKTTQQTLSPECEASVFEAFFRTAQHPALILDLNVNSQRARPQLLNPVASSLLSSCVHFFEESQLEKFNGTFDEFIYSAKRKVEQEIRHTDFLRVLVKSGPEVAEAIYNLTASSFSLGNDTKMLGILLIEITRSIKEELSALERFKESLISALSHELNNPMNSLIPLISMMPSYTHGDKQENCKEMALASANILSNKIRDLIDYAKMQQESIKLNLAEFYVDDLFEEVYRTFKYEAEKKHNALTVKTITQRRKKLLILGDRNRLEQVLVKLVSNANKYTENGAITVTAEENKNNFDIVFAVEDTGIGIAAKKVKTIFASLTQKAKNLDSVARLPGLGLEIASSLCQFMECKLNVTSKQGKGTKFFFVLPVCRIAIFDDTLPGNCFAQLKPQNTFHPNVSQCIEETKADNPIPPNVHPVKSLHLSRSLRELPYIAGDSRSRSKFAHASQRDVGAAKGDACSPLLSPSEELADDSQSVHSLLLRYSYPLRKRLFSDDLVASASKTFPKESVVLVVDDGPSNIMVIREMLNKLNIKSIGCIDGKKAVDAIKASAKASSPYSIELVLMDLNMPIMNGVEATEETRKWEKESGQCREIPIVAVTGQEGEGDKAACFRAGMQEYVKKPVNVKILRWIVRKFVPKLLNSDHDLV